jgi:hypothetical protein
VVIWAVPRSETSSTRPLAERATVRRNSFGAAAAIVALANKAITNEEKSLDMFTSEGTLRRNQKKVQLFLPLSKTIREHLFAEHRNELGRKE